MSAQGTDGDHRDHQAEQAYLNRARAALEAMVERSERALEFTEQRVRDEDSTDARIARAALAERRAAVDVGDVALCFGRIDEDPILTDGDQWYVGRRHIEDADGTPVIVDWRAPVAIPFYRATAADAFGLARRRRFVTEIDELVAIFDEQLDDPESITAAGIPDPVLAEVERGRTGEMSDIVATIAAEQDEIIRAPLDECLLVQGGPGTGNRRRSAPPRPSCSSNTASTRPEPCARDRAESEVFLRYVGNVLPSLGETAVSQATITSLLSSRVRVRRGAAGGRRGEGAGRDGRRAAPARRRPHQAAEGTRRVPLGVRKLRFAPDTIEVAIKTARDNNLPLNDAKSVFTEVLLRDARQQLIDRDVSQEELAQLLPLLRRSEGFIKLVDKVWPNLSGPQLVRSLLGSLTNRKRAAEGLLTGDDADLLQRSSAKKIADEPWTEADLPLLDEANALTSGTGRRFGHVVVDEAQDLSAMALRAAGRRATGGSMTILGDIAQATGIGAQPSWDAVTTALGIDPAMVRRRELTVGYRVPGPILDYANQLLAVTAPEITPSSSIRLRGAGPEQHEVDTAAIPAMVAELAGGLGGDWSTIGVVCPDRHVDEVLAALRDAGLDAGDTRRVLELDHAISVVTPPMAKGLEFDVTIVVEPAAFSDHERPSPALRRAHPLCAAAGGRPFPADAAPSARLMNRGHAGPSHRRHPLSAPHRGWSDDDRARSHVAEHDSQSGACCHLEGSLRATTLVELASAMSRVAVILTRRALLLRRSPGFLSVYEVACSAVQTREDFARVVRGARGRLCVPDHVPGDVLESDPTHCRTANNSPASSTESDPVLRTSASARR